MIRTDKLTIIKYKNCDSLELHFQVTFLAVTSITVILWKMYIVKLKDMFLRHIIHAYTEPHIKSSTE